MPWSVYILRCGDNSLYTGITNNLDNRLKAHTDGKGAKYTKHRGPLVLVYVEAAKDRSAASVREAQIKALKRSEKLALIANT